MPKLIRGTLGFFKTTILKTRHLLPSKLPRGSKDFQDFADSILDTYKLPKIDSYYHSIAVMIQHLPPTVVFKSKAWFASSLYNAQAREVAFYKIAELNKKKKEEEELSKKSVELTPNTH